MSDLSDSTSNYSSFLISSSKHLVMGVSEEDKRQTVNRSGCTSPLSSVGLDENNSHDTSEPRTATHQLEQPSSNDELSSRKRSMTLDLYSPEAFPNGHKEAHCSSLLPSPVLQMLVVTTPELEQFITFNRRDPVVNGLFALTETEEEERYPINVIESLEQLQRQPLQPTLQQNATSGLDTFDSCDWISSDSLTRPLTFEAQAAPTDMRSTQDMRLEQRRERSRIRASMYRQQYLALISALEAKADALKSEKTVLEYDASILRHKVRQLYEMVMMHVKEGCKM